MPEKSVVGPPAPEEKLPEGAAFKIDLYTWLQAFVVVLVGLILVFTFVGRIIGVDGSSMVPTLHDKDMLLLQSIAYAPAQGDVVVLTVDHGPLEGKPIVKRIIALGGQSVSIDYDAGTVSVDGAVLDEPYIKEMMMELPSEYATQVVVPEGSVFVMGDNRNDSTDSRSPRLGVVDARCILGRVHLILLPFTDFGVVKSISKTV